MITAEEFVLELSNDEEQKNFKLATVVDLFENQTAKIEFDGEDIPSEKQYAYLKSYTPETGDRILLAAMGGTYIILGKVNFNVSPDKEEEEYDRYLFNERTVVVMKGIQIAQGVEADTITASGNITGNNITASGALKGSTVQATGELIANSAEITDDLYAGNTVVSKITSNGSGKVSSLDVTGNLYVGGRIGFFGYSPVSQKTVYSATDSNIVSRFNELLSALGSYGLIDNR